MGAVPSQMIQLKYVRQYIQIPSCELAWSILIMITASAKNIQTLYALRFFISLLEPCAFPSYAAILGSWYGPSQLAKRMALSEQSSGTPGMFSGFLQTGLYTGLNGTASVAGWRWLFIFDGIISIPIELWGFFAIPDLPSNTRTFYLTAEDRAYGLGRIRKIRPQGAQTPNLEDTQAGLHQLANLGLRHPLPVCAPSLPRNLNPHLNYRPLYAFFNLYLKDRGYSVVQTDFLPTAGNAVSIVAAFAFGWLSDTIGSRLLVFDAVQAIMMASNIIMATWNVPEAALAAAFYLAYAGGAAQPDVIVADIGGKDAPHYQYGYRFPIAFGLLAVGGMRFARLIEQAG
ncbi:major facilitator superfamily domain-containing protein [Macrophomina phaseolina]|uniref:Major facilitator superfamily domain-containing protein n=1 Tax=Macrophomina phaseolina TaxID=35725 RepID=A0ABQ8GJ39_9PEZI|nr:major facilitator superfamily domain-containing protein [Macrophomina phaseolina]